MTTAQIQKEREVDMAWNQHRNSGTARIPTANEIWEQEERKRNAGKS